MIEIRNLSFSYGSKEVLHRLNAQLDYGKVYALLGKNGTGKTTLFKCLLKLLKPRGEILIEKKKLPEYSPRALAQKIAYVPQAHDAIFNFKVADVILMGRSANLGLLELPKTGDLDRSIEVMEFLGISHLANRGYRELSGGERQLVLIARSMAQDAKILILDEPTANLDYGNQLRVLRAVQKLAREGYLVLLSTHHPEQALHFSDEQLILHGGSFVAQGPFALTEERIREIYGICVKLLRIPYEDRIIETIIPCEEENHGILD